MNATPVEHLAIANDADVVKVRQRVRDYSVRQGFSLVEQTKVVTAASELARNTLKHGHGGHVEIEALADGVRRGLRLAFADQGPGIADIEQALKDGFTTADGLGLGLGGARRLMSEFSIDSTPGAGTRVVVTRWK